jgi:hypothetical protein
LVGLWLYSVVGATIAHSTADPLQAANLSEDVPEIANLHLVGTYVGRDLQIAYIIVDDAVEALYLPGQEIVAGVHIEKIHADSLTLKVGMRLHTLTLRGGQPQPVARKETIAASGGKLTSVTGSGVRDSDTEEQASELVVRMPDGSRSDYILLQEDKSYRVEREYLNTMLDSKRLFKHVEFSSEGGRGIRISELMHGSALHRAGLQKNDIIQEIGGMAITSEHTLLALRDILNSAELVELRINRNNTTKYLYYRLEQ